MVKKNCIIHTFTADGAFSEMQDDSVLFEISQSNSGRLFWDFKITGLDHSKVSWL